MSKPKYNQTPLSYVEMYPAPLEQEKAPSVLAQVVGALLAALAIYALLVVTFSL